MTERAGVLRAAAGLAAALDTLQSLVGDAGGAVDQDAWETTNLVTLSLALAEAGAGTGGDPRLALAGGLADRDDARWSGPPRHRAGSTYDVDHVPRGRALRRGRCVRGDLRAELEAADLDPEAVLAHVPAALEDPLPGGAVDVTSAATIAADARGIADFGARGPGVAIRVGRRLAER